MSEVDPQIVEGIKEMLLHVDKLMVLPVKMGAKETGVEGPSCSRCTEPACCTQVIFSFLIEVIPLAAHLREAGLDTPELRTQLFEAGARMESVDAGDHLEAKVPCVFLKEKRCTVYEYRPVRCRAYFVYDDPENCQPPKHKGVRFANYSRADTMVIQASKKIADKMGLKQTQMRLLVGSLPRVILIALEGMDEDVVFKKHVRSQAWPTVNNLREWIEGGPPEQQLVQIRTRR